MSAVPTLPNSPDIGAAAGGSPPELPQLCRLLDALPCAAVLLSTDGTLVAVNDPAAALLGGDRTSLRNANVLSFYRDEHAKLKLRDALASPDARGELETKIYRPDGKEVAVIASHSRVDVGLAGNGNGVARGPLRLVTLVDIHKLKDTEASLKFQQEFLVQMSDTVMQQALDLKELNDRLEQRVAKRTAELRDANMDAIYMLAVAAEAKDHDTGSHVLRIQRYSAALSLAVGMSEAEADEIGYSSILHDVGKLHVPDQILNKPGPLDEDERRAMEQHTVVGERILSTRPFFRRARLIARSHHENFDASGYPDRTGGERIPVEARIVHVADVFDALVTPRAYKEAWDAAAALKNIVDAAGGQFDPNIVKALSKMHESGELAALTAGFCDLPAR